MCVYPSVYVRLNKTWQRDSVVNMSLTLMFVNNSEEQPQADNAT